MEKLYTIMLKASKNSNTIFSSSPSSGKGVDYLSPLPFAKRINPNGEVPHREAGQRNMILIGSASPPCPFCNFVVDTEGKCLSEICLEERGRFGNKYFNQILRGRGL